MSFGTLRQSLRKAEIPRARSSSARDRFKAAYGSVRQWFRENMMSYTMAELGFVEMLNQRRYGVDVVRPAYLAFYESHPDCR